ncbi:putative RNA methyltransferase At5g10620 isoform X3 [Rosa chinensis]|uniref:putative RNA methyltransferase At5g10620 isoform X3 n=1 Tax=Rosa chinensis TaxID=74649 RepID=UPI001AD8F5A9|nr:putative RNA methyltransferase At5g10620 isoform X3 [Rosa chinensis]
MVVVLSASATNFSALHSGSCFLESLASTLSFLIYFMSLAFTNLILFRISGKGCKYTGQAVRALPIRIISVGKKRSQGVQLVVDDYIQRLKLYCSVEDVHIKNNPKNASDWRAQVDHEDGAVMDLIRSDDWVVLLDERGKDIGSMQMAELIGDAGNTDIFLGTLFYRPFFPPCYSVGSFKTIILCWWTLWTWKTIARAS